MSFDHGNLGSGSSAAMIFVQTAANGDSSNEALIDIEANLEAAFQCLTAPPEPPEPLADVPVPTLSPAGLAALMLLMFGGFAWHRRRMG